MPTGGYIGLDTTYRSTGNAGVNSTYLSKITAQCSGTVTAVLMDMPGAVSGISFKAVIYDGNHSALLATGSTVTSVAANYNRFPLAATLNVTAGTTYYVGYVCANTLNVTIDAAYNTESWYVSGGGNVTTPANPLVGGSAQSNAMMVAMELDGTGQPNFGFAPDHPASITRSVSNTRITFGTGTGVTPGARSIVTHKTGDGKFYAEIRVDGTPGGYATVGLSVVAWNPTQTNYYQRIYLYMLAQNGYHLDNIATGLTFQSGDVMGIAYDAINNFVWWNRNNGLWYGVNTFSGSPTIPSQGLTVQATQWPMALSVSYVNNTPGTGIYTLNDTAGSFYFAPPTGFSAWSSDSYAPAPEIVSAKLTQAIMDQWAQGTPQVQVDRAFIEQWAIVSDAPTAFNMTALAIEEWAVPAAEDSSYAVAQIAIEQWAQAGAADTQYILTQSAIEEWATVSGLPTTIVGPIGVYATGMAGSILPFQGPVVLAPGVYATGVPGTLFALAGGTASRFVFFMQGVF